jgi:RNA polymerase sigma factor (sigma-70 family)
MNEPTADDRGERHKPEEPEDQRQDLVAKAVAGDEEATDELLALIAPHLMRILQRQMGPRLMRYLSVADIAQESLASLLTSLNHLRPGAGLSDVRKLLFQHARWIVMRRGNHAGRYQGESVCQKISRQDRAESKDRSTGNVTLEDELSWLHELIDGMDEGVATVLRKRLNGQSFADLAQELGLGESAVRKRFDRGLDELQRLGEARKHQQP